MEKKICIIVKSYNLDRDIRVQKEINSLKKKFDVIFIGWDRDHSSLKSSIDCREILFNFTIPHQMNIILFWPLWWLFVFSWLIRNKWDTVHAINIDSILPSLLASKIRSRRCIYEILDTYEDFMVLPVKIRYILLKFDKLIMSLSDAIILVDHCQIEEFSGVPNSNITIIYDSPPNILSKLSVTKHKYFTLFYAGVIFKNRKLNLETIIEVAKSLEGIQLILAGYGDLVDEIQKCEKQMPDKLKFIGRISYGEALERCKNSDLLFVLRDPVIPVNRYICGSTLLNAMMCGIPILVNKGTSTADKVLKENCGLIIDAEDVNEIKKAIMKLRDDPELCKLLGTNGRKAYEERYSWDIMGQKLIDLYQDLTKSSDDHPLTTQKLVAKEVRK